MVAHACNSSYSIGRDYENPRFEATLGKQFVRPYLEKKKQQQKKNHITTKGLAKWLKV
jgi:hypothetical protein